MAQKNAPLLVTDERFTRNVSKITDMLTGIHYHFSGDLFTIPNGHTTIKIWPIATGKSGWEECLYGEYDNAFHRVFPDPSCDCDAIPCACVEASIYVRRRYFVCGQTS